MGQSLTGTQIVEIKMGKEEGKEELLGAVAIKPPGWDRTGWEAFGYFLYDPDNGTFLSRTPLSWLKITVFYTIYYSCLAAFWYVCLLIFFQTLPEVDLGPKWMLGGSLIGENPGVGIRPLNRDSRIDSNMFKLQLIDDNRVLTDAEGEGDLNIDYARRAEKFLEVYESEVNKTLGYNEFNLATELGECGAHPYGYVNGGSPIKPCIFLKFNKIWGWNPKPITAEDFDANEWPKSFKNHFDSLGENDQDQVFVDCQGRYPADKEALKEGMTYIPATQGFPVKYFPYKGDKENYHSPLVVVQFDTSRMERFVGQLIHVECRAYYQGVVHTTKTKTGMVQFEVLLENKLSLSD